MESSTLDAMAAAIQYRGPLSWWRADPIALAATRSSCPGSDAGDGIVVIADARIDNADELRRTLGLVKAAPVEVIIAAAYRRWRDDCPAYLFGDFAFVLWEPNAKRVFCARDVFGVRPFYYHLSDTLFVAATTINAVIALHDVGTEIDDAAMADFVAGTVTSTTSTLYSQVRRLPPAHSLCIEQERTSLTRYWRVEDAPDVSGRDIGDRFRSVFVESVRSHMGDISTCGVMLSGGLDSSSISAVVASDARSSNQKVRALSLTFDRESGWNEQRYIDAVLGLGGLDPIFIDSCEHDPVAGLSALIGEQEGPFLGYNASVSRQLYHVARATGLTTILDGHGGDEVVSHGIGRLNELARVGRWWTMLREASGVAAINGLPLRTVVGPYASHNRAVRAIRRRHAAWSTSDPAADDSNETTLVAEDLASRTEIVRRVGLANPPRRAAGTEREEHIATLSHPLQPYTLESLERSSAAAGVTSAYPFYDRRLVELCVGAPSESKLSGGMPRFLLREAMKGLLPEDVRLRRDKFNFSGQLATGLLRHHDTIERMIVRDESGIGRFINRKVAGSALEGLAAGQSASGTDIFKVWRTLALGLWLSQRS